MANLKTVLRFLRILARKIYAQGGKKRKKVSTFHVQKVPTPHHFSNGPYLLQQDAESDDEE